MKYWITIGLVIILLSLIGYSLYVKGWGIKPKLDSPITFELGGTTLTTSWEVKAEMPTERTEVAGAALSNKIYIIGGFDSLGQTLSTVEIYDPKTDSWSKGENIPEPRHHTTVTSVGGKLYLIGGYQGSTSWEVKDSVFEFDPEKSLWSQKAPMPTPRGGLNC